VENENGCEAEALIRVVVLKDFPVLVPTGFTPNGDGENDVLLVHGLPGIRVLTFRIFDRWGELLFQQGDFNVNDENIGWDGAFRGKPLNGGVFIWQVDALMPDGRTERFTGQTTLLR
jgi:gliding motility-associated-like protein